jgi:iron complex outermembrane recepter protein
MPYPRPAPFARLRPSLLAIGCIGVASAPASVLASGAAPAELDRIVVTATRSDRDPFEVPASIDSVEVDRRLRLGASPAELLRGIPGLLARDRQNYAQDTQISIRGFGARSSFGIRGVRLYTDGIPASQPDGQGQVSHFNLDTAERIEVLRGPFSALYGNASGGVVQVFTAEGTDPPETRIGLTGGSHGTLRATLGARGREGDFDYNIGYTYFSTDGYRDHASARRHSLNAKFGYGLAGGGRLTLVGNLLAQPFTEDPLGITREQFEQDPTQTTSVAKEFNTRKRVDQGQAGAILEQPFGSRDTLRVMGYAGSRDVVQFLAIPAGPQNSPTHAGGVIDLGTGYGGTDVRWTRRLELGARPMELSAGIAYDTLRQKRRGYENFVGDRLGVRGRLRRNEVNTVDSFDQYAQLDWRLADAWSLLAGIRHSTVEMRSKDRYVAAGNPDDSGSVEYSDTTPVAGLMFHATEALNLYASWGQAFETPTFAEAGYRADGGAGLALDLRPVTSDNAEIGAKWRQGALRAELAVFQSDSDDELAVATSVGGRTTYQNIGSSRRRGGELSVDWQFAEALGLAFAYSHVDARFTSGFLGCSARCAAPDTPVPAGTRIPGVPRDTAWLALQWQGADGWRAAADVAYSGEVTVNDFGTERAPSHALLGAELGRDWTLASGELRTFLRVDNLADRDHVGSVIVNDGNGRFYEPGLGRSWVLGLQWRGRH